MLGMRALLLVFALSFCGYAWSSNPEKPEANSGKHQANSKQIGTKASPLFVNGEVTTKKDQEETRNDADERKVKAETDTALVKYTGLLALFTFLLFCFTAALWWVTFQLSRDAKETSARQAREMKASLEIAEEVAYASQSSADAAQDAADAMRASVTATYRIARKQLRAYIFAKDIVMTEVANPDIGLVDNLRITIVLGNGGNTPTKNLLMNTNWEPFEEPMGNDFDFPDRPYGNPVPSMIGPGATSHTPHVDIPVALMDHVARRFQHVYVWGWADYDDVVGGKRHRTEFCFEILKDGDLVSFRPHGKFNGSDSDCYRAPSAYRQ